MERGFAVRQPWLPYVAPMATFLILTSLEGWLPRSEGGPHPHWYPLFYTLKAAIVAAVAWACRSAWRDLVPRPRPMGWALAVALGLGVTALWVGLDGLYPQFGASGTRAAFDPGVLPMPTRALFLAVRFFGLVVLVPLIEELFWRSFAMRWIIDPDFLRVPIGRVTPAAAVLTAALFALEHPEEWLPALLTGLAWAGLLRQSRSVSACIVSHAAANLALGLYVLATGAWRFW
ncbi:MAG: CAAX prenyl protease-related protein [Isosphaeraceae bacterium]|nr:CAAX prenyl protease-related protein [Isosphaeraceae bacterium]